MTALSLPGMELMRFCTVVNEIGIEDFRRRRSSAVSVRGSGWHKHAVAAIAYMLQTFSIGDKSGDFGGPSSGEM